MTKYKPLTMDERHDIELCLHKKLPFKEIGRILGRDPTTISKEVVNHIKVREVGGRSMRFNACQKRELRNSPYQEIPLDWYERMFYYSAIQQEGSA